MHFIQQYGRIHKFYSRHEKIRLTISTVGAIQNMHSTVQLNQKTHFNTIFESTWHHNRHLSSLAKMVDIIWDAIVWQHPFLTSGHHDLDFWNSIQKNMITILIHILQLSAVYQNMGLSNCILGMGNLTWYVHVPVQF